MDAEPLTATEESEYLSTTEVAEMMDASSSTVYRYVERGLLPVAHRIAAHRGAYLYRRSDVEALLEQLVPVLRLPRQPKAS